MFVRSQIWQDPIFESESQSGWENIIVLNYPCVDIRFKLKGYGWKPQNSITNLTILYEGRYDCYYRQRGAVEWIHFLIAFSERASYEEARVYEDTISTLGVVPNRLYEIKIVASDAEKFKGWGGVVEGIREDEKFYYDLKVRADKPIQISLYEKIEAREYSYGGMELFDFSLFDSIYAIDVIIPNLIHQLSFYQSITTTEFSEIEIPIGIDFYETIFISEYIVTQLPIACIKFEGLLVTENINIII